VYEPATTVVAIKSAVTSCPVTVKLILALSVTVTSVLLSVQAMSTLRFVLAVAASTKSLKLLAFTINQERSWSQVFVQLVFCNIAYSAAVA